MITIDNYFQAINKISFSDAPEALYKGHEFLVDATDNGQDMEAFKEDEQVKKTIDLYLSKLNEFILKSEETNEASSAKVTKKTGKKSSAPKRATKKEKQKSEKENSDNRFYQDVKKMDNK